MIPVEPFELRGKTIAEVYQEPSELVYDHGGVQGMQIRMQFTDGSEVVIKQEMKEYHIGKHASTEEDDNWFVACDGITQIYNE